MPDAGIIGLTALQLRDRIASDTLRPSTVAAAFLQQIEAREPEVGAWAFIDRDYVMSQAETLEAGRSRSEALGLLYGVPVAVKDIIDTAAMPTENGTVIDTGRRPGTDAAVVERLQEAGAIVLGKAVTTELAAFGPGKTRNPHDRMRTPGGSSSGSAAAVAARMVPLAIGTQTNGSVIRPASFCGVVGFKPTRGTISRRGILPQAPTLDQIGVFSQTVQDAALLVDALAGFDALDWAMRPSARPNLLATATGASASAPKLAFVRSPVWEKASGDTRAGFDRLVKTLGAQAEPVELPASFNDAHRRHRLINMAELAQNYAHYYDRDRERLTAIMQGMVEEGRAVRAVDYLDAVASIASLYAEFEKTFAAYDAIVTPAACGEAPVGNATGDPAFNTIWTFLGVPALTLPLLTGENGLPIGAQLVGRRNDDGRLVRVGRWLASAVTTR